MVPATPPAVRRAGEQHLRLEDLGGCRLAQPQQGRRHQHGGRWAATAMSRVPPAVIHRPQRTQTRLEKRSSTRPTSSRARMTTPWFTRKNRLICWMPLLSPQGVRKLCTRAVAEQHEEVHQRGQQDHGHKGPVEPERGPLPLPLASWGRW